MTSNKSLFNCFISVALICFTWKVAIGQQNNEWPNLHGADRTNKSTETDLLQEWPETGPIMLAGVVLAITFWHYALHDRPTDVGAAFSDEVSELLKEPPEGEANG